MDSVVKTPVSLRLSDDLLRFVDQQAQQNGVTRTAMISILLNSARQSYK
ncbi:ribbon-helix-helix domain-containing protein [Latilactobacillus curvatus]|nr:CopG family transcriptional regulator [Latilactobacillus curvatus]MCM6862201.1 ribbon-helix-helix domain-containing protein [Latilactobacillus curvatus]MCM6869476.1 ribbon-helix-helix domain-containing protein [Latilactobacillus curvatus]